MTLPASGSFSARELNIEVERSERAAGSAGEAIFRRLAQVGEGAYSAKNFMGKKIEVEITLSKTEDYSEKVVGGWFQSNPVDCIVNYAGLDAMKYQWEQVGKVNPKVRVQNGRATLRTLIVECKEPVKGVQWQCTVRRLVDDKLIGVSPVLSITFQWRK
ncbi:hypothetical protein ABH309_17555 [Chromobacterium piscinae]|uniref:Uncharacterized protein n=4 Tax=Chromobacterium piscinae TaxID=686831 RepID=A0ABV0H830_9NEIS